MAVPPPREVFFENRLGRAVVLAKGPRGSVLRPFGMAARGGSFAGRWGNGLSIPGSTTAPPNHGSPNFYKLRLIPFVSVHLDEVSVPATAHDAKA
jgi:hypothetical protein